jgi:hypothetical protein
MFNWRDYEMVPKPQSTYAKIFGAPREYEFRKASRYGGHLRHRHDGNLDRPVALHWLLHTAPGAAMLNRLNLPPDEAADLLVRAAQMHPTEKRHEAKMDITKTLRAVGEHGFSEMIRKYARTVYPELTREQAFTKEFTADDDEGRAIRRAWMISKGQGIPAGALDEPTDDDDDESALDELNELAAEERRRNPKLTKQAAFTKVYTDLSNVELVKRERRANRPRA